MLYFDHNATTPLLPEAREAWLEASDKFIGNPSSPHRVGSRADMHLQTARVKLADILGCDPLDIVWTSGATESNNMVLHHLARTVPAAARILSRSHLPQRSGAPTKDKAHGSAALQDAPRYRMHI